jgi:ADP-ribose pyrophosphatase YjhB (NUDIX family)
VPSYYRDPAAPEPNRPRGTGVTALIERNGQVLVERRADDADVWAFIGGTLGDESVLDALHRDVRKETRFEIEHATLPFWPVQVPIREAFLGGPAAPVVA